MEKRHCAYCDGVIAGRTDKKFCNAACRSAYHNENFSLFLKKIRPVLHILQNNRRILHELFEERKSEAIPIQMLDERGYKFAYCTEHTRDEGKEWYCCFDMALKKEIQGMVVVMPYDQMVREIKPLPEMTVSLINNSIGQSPDTSPRKRL